MSGVQKKKVKISFLNDLYEYICNYAEKTGNNVTYSLTDCLVSTSDEIVEEYADEKFLKVSKINVSIAAKGKTLQKVFAFSEDVYALILQRSENRNQTFSQYVNLVISAFKNSNSSDDLEIFEDEEDEEEYFEGYENPDEYYGYYDNTISTSTPEINIKIEDKNDKIIIDEKHSVLKSEALIGLPSDLNKMMVLKSEVMFSLMKSYKNVAMLKLFDVILGRINPLDPDKRTVVLTKQEWETASNQRISRKQMDEYIRTFVEKTSIEYITDNRSDFLNLFEAGSTIDYGNRSWKAAIKCTESADVFFNLTRYAKFPMADIAKLSTPNQYLLYQHIMFFVNFGKKTWTIDIPELKRLLQPEGELDDMTNSRFVDKKLKPAIEKINKCTGCNVSFKTVLNHGKITQITFSATYKIKGASSPIELPSPTDNKYLTPEEFVQERMSSSDDYSFIVSSINNLVEKYINRAGLRCDSFDFDDLKNIYFQIKEYIGNRFSNRNVLSILDSVLDKLIKTDCFSVLTACDYAKSAYDILVSKELDTSIDNPILYLKGIINNGHPDLNKNNWFGKISQSDNIKYSSTKGKSIFIEREFNNDELNDFLEMSLMD